MLSYVRSVSSFEGTSRQDIYDVTEKAVLLLLTRMQGPLYRYLLLDYPFEYTVTVFKALGGLQVLRTLEQYHPRLCSHINTHTLAHSHTNTEQMHVRFSVTTSYLWSPKFQSVKKTKKPHGFHASSCSRVAMTKRNRSADKNICDTSLNTRLISKYSLHR